jgi:hypothetical protein
MGGCEMKFRVMVNNVTKKIALIIQTDKYQVASIDEISLEDADALRQQLQDAVKNLRD